MNTDEEETVRHQSPIARRRSLMHALNIDSLAQDSDPRDARRVATVRRRRVQKRRRAAVLDDSESEERVRSTNARDASRSSEDVV